MTSETEAPPAEPQEDLGFDPDALREKYRAGARQAPARRRQRAVRRGRRASSRTTSTTRTSSPGSTREPLTDEVEVVVIGGGFGGLLAGARLREAGVDDIRIIEKGGDFGGTWYWNRYPGAQCDVESYIYLPLLEEIGYIPKEKYARAPEILAHSRRDRRALRPLPQRAASRPRSPSCAGTTTRRAGSSRPTAATAMRARFVVHAERPAEPAEAARHPGHRDVQGPHVPHQPLGLRLHRRRLRRATSTGLRDKRVGIIGTGATAVQCVPHLGEAAEQLYVFQRTPSSIDVRANRPTDPEWAASARSRAGRSSGWTTSTSSSPAASRTRTSSATAGPTSSATCSLHGPPGRRAPRSTADGLDEDDGAGRLREDGADPRPRRRDRRGPGDGRGAEAVLPPVLQAAVLPRRVPRHVQPAERHARRHEGQGRRARSPRTASSSTASSTRSTASSTPPASRSAPTTRAAPGYELHGRDGVDADARSGRTASATLHGMHSRGFPNCFIIGPQQSGFTRELPAHARRAGASTSPTSSSTRIDNDVAAVEVVRGGRGRSGSTRSCSSARMRPRVPRGVHARLLQQRGQGLGPRRRRTASTAAARSRSSRSWTSGGTRLYARARSKRAMLLRPVLRGF